VTRVYIKGDLGDKQNLKVFDAATGEDLLQTLKVQSINISVGINQHSMVELTYLDMADPMRIRTLMTKYDLVPRPAAKASGTSLYQFGIEQEYDPARSATKLLASMIEREVQDDGRTKRVGQPMQVSEEISDAELYSVRGTPDEHIERKAGAAVGVMMYELAEKIAKQRAIAPATGGYVARFSQGVATPPPSGFVKNAIRKTAQQIQAGAPIYRDQWKLPPLDPTEKAKIDELLACVECKGTGVYQPLFGASEPCKGCTP
jgi:hypothetical protein